MRGGDESNPSDLLPSTETGVTVGFSETYQSNGLGKAVDVINGKGYEPISGGVSIFDTDKLYKTRLEKYRIGKQEARVVSSKSYEQFAREWSVDASLKIGSGKQTPICMPRAVDFNVDLKGGYQSKKSSETEAFYYKMHQNITGDRVEIQQYRDTEKFSAMLSDSFLQDAQKVGAETMTPSAFIHKYGTHVIMAAYYGGAIEADYFSIEHKSTANSEWYASAKMNLTNYLMSVGGDVDVKSFNSDSSTSRIAEFGAKAIGGESRAFGSLEGFASGYEQWAVSVNENSYSLIDVPNESLYCVWDYLDASYKKAKDILDAYVMDNCNAAYANLAQKFASIVDENGAELGTESNPYRIFTAADFYKIEKNDGKNVHFALANDIDLLYSSNSLKTFHGVLNGNGYSISNYRRTIPATAYSAPQYCGLIEENHGTVKNLTVEAAHIAGDEYHGNDKRVYVGGIVGANRSDGVIIGVTAKNCVLSPINRSGAVVGGITGFNEGEISDCYMQYARFFTNGDCGGVAGENAGLIRNVACIGNPISGSVKDNQNRVTFEYYIISKLDNAGSLNRPLGGPKCWGGIVGRNHVNGRVVGIALEDVYMYVRGHKDQAVEMGYAVGHNAGFLGGAKQTARLGNYKEVVVKTDYYFATNGGLVGRNEPTATVSFS